MGGFPIRQDNWPLVIRKARRRIGRALRAYLSYLQVTLHVPPTSGKLEPYTSRSKGSESRVAGGGGKLTSQIDN